MAVLGRDDGVLDLLEDLGAQLDVARLVDAVHVAEGEGRHVAALLAQAEGLDGRQAVLGGRVELLVDLVGDAVLFATDDADLDLEDDVRLGDGPASPRRSRGSPQRHGRAVPHVRLEQRGRPALTRSAEMASSGRTKPSSLSFGQWSVCRAMLTG
jgi:hypothetical protein